MASLNGFLYKTIKVILFIISKAQWKIHKMHIIPDILRYELSVLMRNACTEKHFDLDQTNKKKTS